MHHAGFEETYDGLRTLLVRNVYLKSQPQDVQTFIKEKGLKVSLDEMITLSESYREAHNVGVGQESKPHQFLKKRNGKGDEKEKSNDKSESNNNSTASSNHAAGANQKSDVRRCFKCNSTSHLASSCSEKVNIPGPRPVTDDRKCYQCNETGHIARNCNQNQNKKFYGNKNAACSIIMRDEIEQNRICSDAEMAVKLPTGDRIPIVAAVSVSKPVESFLPELSKPHRGVGLVNGERVKFVRDTASSITIVRANLVQPNQMLDETVTCMLADGCIKTFKLANINVATPYFTA